MKNIVDTALEIGTFTQLLAALKTGSLLDTLRAPGPYTLFAPSDAAFAKLSAGSLRSLLKDTRRLKNFLALHILSGTYSTDRFVVGEIRTVEGHFVDLSHDGQCWAVNASRISQADLIATNGAIHVIDSVISLTPGLLPAVA